MYCDTTTPLTIRTNTKTINVRRLKLTSAAINHHANKDIATPALCTTLRASLLRHFDGVIPQYNEIES
ncbi:MAG: hypothetical protein ACI978_001398 [Oleispira sp.]|jgi:hypothetical protein